MKIREIEGVRLFHTTTLLAAGGVYPSDWFFARNHSFITGSVTSNVSGTLKIEHSPDRATVTAEDTHALGAGEKIKYKLTLTEDWVRVVYTNGATAQSSFSLSAYLRSG